MAKLTIVVPVYNEEDVLKNSVATLLAIADSVVATDGVVQEADMLLVDDGSKDQTWALIEALHQANPRVNGLRFSRNFGHQQALIAGMREAIDTADLVITIDADLQDDPEKIPEMVAQYEAGADVVYGVRNNRDSDGWFKRTTAEGYYQFLRLLGVDLIPNHADYRLMSKRAVEALMNYTERNIFIRGLIPKLGFKTAEVYYKRTPRQAGESKYPLRKMLHFAWDGITSLTIAPVRLMMVLGMIGCVIAIVMLINGLVVKLLGLSYRGWSSLMMSLWFIGGVQMIGMGIIGEYVGKLTLEVKRRPRYTVQTRLK